MPIFDENVEEVDIVQSLYAKRLDLIVLTQSCDLLNMKAGLVAFSPVFSVSIFEQANPKFATKGAWEEVRKGRREGLYLLPSPTQPDNNREALLVDFRQIFILPYAYLTKHAESLAGRWRLLPPFLEHFSQGFARFFMRVGLPAAIPPYV